MSERNVEALRRLYAAWAEGDFTTGLSMLERNVTLVVDAATLDGGVFVGEEGVKRYMTRFLQAWESLNIVATGFRDRGDTVVAEVEQTGVGRDSGAPVKTTYFQLWTFRGAKVVRLETILSEAEALEAAGMAEGNVERMRRGLDAFNRADKAAWLAEFDPDAVMVPARQWPENAPVRGAEAIWDFYRAVGGTWAEGASQVGEVIDSADKVLVNYRRDARGKASGAAVEFNYWQIATFREGKAVRLEWFATRAEALEAAGLRG